MLKKELIELAKSIGVEGCAKLNKSDLEKMLLEDAELATELDNKPEFKASQEQIAFDNAFIAKHNNINFVLYKEYYDSEPFKGQHNILESIKANYSVRFVSDFTTAKGASDLITKLLKAIGSHTVPLRADRESRVAELRVKMYPPTRSQLGLIAHLCKELGRPVPPCKSGKEADMTIRALKNIKID